MDARGWSVVRGLWLVKHQPLLDCCGGARVLFVRASCALSHAIITSHRMAFSSLSRHDRTWRKSGERKIRYADVDALNRSRRPVQTVQTAQTAQLAASTAERAVVCTLQPAMLCCDSGGQQPQSKRPLSPVAIVSSGL